MNEVLDIPKKFVIAVDGLAASGKGALSKRLASDLGIRYLDTGKLYRYVAFESIRNEIAIGNIASLASLARSLDLKNISLLEKELGKCDIGNAASKIAALPEVRSALVDVQRKFAHGDGGAILDGRDIGTVICSDADVKFFVTANLQIRAERRMKQVHDVKDCNDDLLHKIMKDLEKRDESDQNRSIAPLIKAQDAISINTSHKSIEDSFEEMMKYVRVILQ